MKKEFYKLVSILENCCDTTIKNDQGVITERGVTLENGNSITYGLDDNLIRFYVENKEVLQFDDESPILLMFEQVINWLYEY